MEARKLRILFIDDEELPVFELLKKEGFDVTHWRDVESLEQLVDDRYPVIFLDVRGVGSRFQGNGLDILKYVRTHNPLIYTVIFSAKPFTGSESELIRTYADKALQKDCTLFDIVELLEAYSKPLNKNEIIERLSAHVKLTFFTKLKLKCGVELGAHDIQSIARTSGLASDSVTIVANTLKIASTLIALAA